MPRAAAAKEKEELECIVQREEKAESSNELNTIVTWPFRPQITQLLREQRLESSKRLQERIKGEFTPGEDKGERTSAWFTSNRVVRWTDPLTIVFRQMDPAPEKDPLLTFKVKFASPPGEEQLLT